MEHGMLAGRADTAQELCRLGEVVPQRVVAQSSSTHNTAILHGISQILVHLSQCME